MLYNRHLFRNMKKHLPTFVFLLLCVFALAHGDECAVIPRCTCQIDDTELPVEEATAGTEALAGAVGAIGSSLVGGGGFAIWHMVKSRSSGNSVDFGRSDSALSEESIGPQKGGRNSPAEYEKSQKDEQSSPKTPNIYRTGISRDLANKKPAPIIQPGVDF